MDAQALTEYIRQGIRKEVYADRIALYLPFFFGSALSVISLEVREDEGL